jgi:hypothetical protein
MTPNDDPHVVGPPAVPQCKQCQSAESVRPVHIPEVNDGVHYWACGECGLVWATNDDEALGSRRGIVLTASFNPPEPPFYSRLAEGRRAPPPSHDRPSGRLAGLRAPSLRITSLPIRPMARGGFCQRRTPSASIAAG